MAVFLFNISSVRNQMNIMITGVMQDVLPEVSYHKDDRVIVLPSRIPSVITSINTFTSTK